MEKSTKFCIQFLKVILLKLVDWPFHIGSLQTVQFFENVQNHYSNIQKGEMSVECISVISSYTCQTCHANFLPLPMIAEVMSKPVNA